MGVVSLEILLVLRGRLFMASLALAARDLDQARLYLEDVQGLLEMKYYEGRAIEAAG